MTHAPARQSHSALGRFVRNPETGEVVIAQPPNLPLWVWLAATVARLSFRPDGSLATVLSVVATVSLVVWALLEIVRGDSPFRRVLGGVVLAAVVIGLLTQ